MGPYDKSWLQGFNPNFPTEFQDAVTYYEEMKRCYEKMHECLHYLMEHEKQMEELTRQITAQMINTSEARTNTKINKVHAELEATINAQIKLVKSSIIDLSNNMDRFEMETNTRFSQFFSGLDLLTADLNQEIEKIYNQLAKAEADILSIESKFNDFKGHVTGMFADELQKINERVDEQLSRLQGDRILVTNPLTGYREGLGDVLRDLAQYQAPFPITASQFDSLALTADEFDAMNLTANDFNNRAGLIFFTRLNFPPIWAKFEAIEGELEGIKDETWASLISGRLLPPYEAYEELAQLFIGRQFSPITAAQFDALSISADDFDAKDITARVFNLYGVRDSTGAGTTKPPIPGDNQDSE